MNIPRLIRYNRLPRWLEPPITQSFPLDRQRKILMWFLREAALKHHVENKDCLDFFFILQDSKASKDSIKEGNNGT